VNAVVCIMIGGRYRREVERCGGRGTAAAAAAAAAAGWPWICYQLTDRRTPTIRPASRRSPRSAVDLSQFLKCFISNSANVLCVL